MEYKTPTQSAVKIKPRIIIHGGAGVIKPANLSPADFKQHRHALLTIISKTDAFMNTPKSKAPKHMSHHDSNLPSALETASYAAALLEDCPLFNSGHGAVFTRDGINELEASVMVSKGHKKRAVGVSGIRGIKNPILLAKAILEAGEDDLEANVSAEQIAQRSDKAKDVRDDDLDVPSAQGHGHLHGPEVTEALARKYKLDLVEPSYYFTQKRWDEHVRALERENRQGGTAATWSANEYLPQGTCGAVALDEDGVVCVTTTTGGLTNKLTGRVGDTPTVGAGFWAGEWEDEIDQREDMFGRSTDAVVSLSDTLKALMADCLPAPTSMYTPLNARHGSRTRSFAASGTGNGDSFLRVAAVHAVAARAQWKPQPCRGAMAAVAGPGGELQRSAGDRWGRTGEGQGGMIGIELVVDRDDEGKVVGVKSEILKDLNCDGMFRAWIDDKGRAQARIWADEWADSADSVVVDFNAAAKGVRGWVGEKHGALVSF